MRKEVTYYTPNLKAPRIFADVLEEHNTLIAGAVGSGKTTFENGLIYSLLNDYTPAEAVFFLIDPKQFELRHFRNVPHCSGYADTPEDSLKILDVVERLREARSNWMKNHGLRKWQGSVVYLFIDELADLMTGDRKFAKEFCEKLVKIMQLGRALNIRVVALTQQPRREVTPARLQVNFTCNVALHCRSAIESRQIIGIPGAEDLPRYGECYVSSAGYVEKKNVPYITDDTMNAMIDYWTSEKCLTGDTTMIESTYGGLNMKNKYYWLDTDYHTGDFTVPKFSLIQGEIDEDGQKDRGTEETILICSYADAGIDPHGDPDWNEFDSIIEKELGFLPEYEIN